MTWANKRLVEPDLWLICSAAAFQAIEGYWCEEAGEGSLLQWRLSCGLIEYVEPDKLGCRLVREAAARDRRIVLLFDEVDERALSLIETALNLLSNSLELQVVEWRASPMTALIAMNSPDSVLLRYLQDPISSDEHALLALSHRDSSEKGASFLAALKAWEEDCRACHCEDFSTAYPHFVSKPIDWSTLVGDRASRVTANDNDWVFLRSAAAGSVSQDGTPFRLEAPPESPDSWDLTWAPKDGAAAGYLIFSCHPGSARSLVGCHVLVRSKGEVFDLGVVEEDGIAQIFVSQRVDVGDVWVSISRKDVN